MEIRASRDGKPPTIFYDKIHGDKLKFEETTNYLTFKDATLAREGVFFFQELKNCPEAKKAYGENNGLMFRPYDVLKKNYPLRTELPTIFNHPETGIIKDPNLVKGKTYFRPDDKTRSLKGDVQYFKRDPTTHAQLINVETLEKMKKGDLRDLSIGYHNNVEYKPGVWNGQKYDWVEKTLWLDHCATVEKGRCGSPLCGLGADRNPQLGLDPRHPSWNSLFKAFKDKSGYHAFLNKHNLDDSKPMSKKRMSKIMKRIKSRKGGDNLSSEQELENIPNEIELTPEQAKKIVEEYNKLNQPLPQPKEKPTESQKKDEPQIKTSELIQYMGKYDDKDTVKLIDKAAELADNDESKGAEYKAIMTILRKRLEEVNKKKKVKDKK